MTNVIRSIEIRRHSNTKKGDGPHAGQILVWSLWRAEIELAPWEPRFEVTHRRIVTQAEVIDQLTMANDLARIVSRALR